MELAGVSLWGPGDKTKRRLKVQKPATNKEEEEDQSPTGLRRDKSKTVQFHGTSTGVGLRGASVGICTTFDRLRRSLKNPNRRLTDFHQIFDKTSKRSLTRYFTIRQNLLDSNEFLGV